MRRVILQRLKTLGWTRHRLAVETKLRTATVYNYLRADKPTEVESNKAERMLSVLGLEIRARDCPRCGECGDPLTCDIEQEEYAAGENVIRAAKHRQPDFTPAHVHRYIDMQRRMLLAKFEADSYKIRLQGPRIGILIKLTRDATGLNQEQLAKRCGVDPTYLSKLANEKEEAGFSFLEALYYEWEKTQSYESLPQKQRLSNEYAPLHQPPRRVEGRRFFKGRCPNHA